MDSPPYRFDSNWQIQFSTISANVISGCLSMVFAIASKASGPSTRLRPLSFTRYCYFRELLYDEGDDVYRCPNGKALALRTLYRSSNGLYWVYRAELSDCRQCTMRGICLCDSHREQGRRTLCNYFEAAVQSGRKRRNSSEYFQALRLRQIWCDPNFSQQPYARISRCSRPTGIFSSSCQEPHPYTDHHNPQKRSL